MNKKLLDWLATQPKEFADEILSNDILGDTEMSIAKLRELDEKYNPEDI